MAEQVFRSPGFFEREIDLSQREKEIVGVPAGVIGTAETGPAFIPVTIGSVADFEARFGSLDPTMFGPYAVNEFLKNRTALTYIRVLGAGTNETNTDFVNTRNAGIVKSAGFIVKGGTTDGAGTAIGNSNGYAGAVQFIVARHYVSESSDAGYPIFYQNDSFSVDSQRILPANDKSASRKVNLVRAMLFTPTGSCFQILDTNVYPADQGADEDHFLLTGSVGSTAGSSMYKRFKLVLSTSAGGTGKYKYNDEQRVGIKIYTASLDPSDDMYIGNILNTDPEQFQRENHLLYADFAVEDELATVSNQTGAVAIVSGSANTDDGAGLSSTAFRDLYGRFDTRYNGARTTSFISQPYGDTEYDLFHFETISDGAAVNTKFKISISNVRKSTDPKNSYGTFTVLVRGFGDTDTGAQILEQYSQCTLDPNSADYIGKKVGDLKVVFNFDAESSSERRFVTTGKHPNMSTRVRIVMNSAVEDGLVPADALPFGFRGLPVLKTSDTLTDSSTKLLDPANGETLGAGLGRRFAMMSGSADGKHAGDGVHPGELTGSILPPVPMTFKVTRGNVSTTIANAPYGQPGTNEIVDSRYYWGIKTTRIPRTGTLDNSLLNVNAGGETNNLVKSYTKFLGLPKAGTMVTGSGADAFCNNKFSLTKVAFLNFCGSDPEDSDLASLVVAQMTGTAPDHMKEAAYMRNGKVDKRYYTVNSGSTFRITLGTLASLTSSTEFNKFSDYTKFTNIFYGGFDGVNILDTDMARLNDKASSSDTGGKATAVRPAVNTALDIGLSGDMLIGSGKDNNVVASYRAASEIMLDPMTTRVNILAIPGIRDAYVTDFTMDLVKDYSQAIYLLDMASYDDDKARIYDGDDKRVNVTETISKFESRALDSNYSATYFPDVSMTDASTGNPVELPASIAALAALGFNDNVSYPWFAPAGFNRGALSTVANTKARLTAGDRDTLYEARINPIASFPNAGFVIFGQKTLQQARSALDRVNVRRMLLEVKRVISGIGNTILFEQNTPSTRNKFVALATPQLALIQAQQGIDEFRIVMDETNNTQEDIESNKLNGKIVVVPTRAVEFISIDFIITNAGVEFV